MKTYILQKEKMQKYYVYIDIITTKLRYTTLRQNLWEEHVCVWVCVCVSVCLTL